MRNRVLDRRITLLRASYDRAPVDDGTPGRSLVPLAEVWAHQARASETDRTGRHPIDFAPSDRRTYRIRYRPDFTSGERWIRVDGMDLSVNSTTEPDGDRRKWLDISVDWG